jgi:teichuronic acid biosynthesis glycosyltransferase TuaC
MELLTAFSTGTGFAGLPASEIPMKIFYLCKRRYMNQDVILDRYGRLYHLPNELSLLGHDVRCNCLSYKKTYQCNEIHREKSEQAGQLSWQSEYAGTLGWKIPFYIRRIIKDIISFQPDMILGSSDALHAVIASWVAHRTNTPYFLDLYDNYESFGMSKIPGMLQGYRKALRDADGIFTVSNTLRDYVRNISPNTPVTTIESTISTGSFSPGRKAKARKALKLPKSRILIGTAGALSTNRGTEHLYKAFFSVKKSYSDACLVLAGPPGDNPPPDHPDIIYLGQLPHSTVPLLFNALDVAVICMKNDKFGKYAFPQKAYEILACNVPVVCAAVGALKELLREYQSCLYSPDDPTDLAGKIVGQLNARTIPDLSIPTWRDQAKKLEQNLQNKLLL